MQKAPHQDAAQFDLAAGGDGEGCVGKVVRRQPLWPTDILRPWEINGLGLDHGAARAVAKGKGMAIKWRRVFPAVALIENEVVRLRTAKARSARSGT